MLQSGLTVRTLSTVQELGMAICESAGAAVITEEVLQNGPINSLAGKIAAQPPWSDFPFIVLTGSGLSTASSEFAVLSRAPLGNVTLLERPLRPVTLISTVRSALLARRRQYEVRDHLRERDAAEEALHRAHDALESLVEQRTAALRRLSVKLLTVQDEERRRIARELHDSLGQDLTAAKICLDMMAQEPGKESPHLHDAQSLVDRCIVDTRTLSHLLHPPLLDEAGLASAAKWYVEGFGRRSGIATHLDVSEHMNRLPRPAETALFRILQEELTSVHRHSSSKAVEVHIRSDDTKVVLIVRDFGKGMLREVLDRLWKTGNVGVGLAGIREPLKELHGYLEIESNKEGTLLKATIPVSAADASENREEERLWSKAEYSRSVLPLE